MDSAQQQPQLSEVVTGLWAMTCNLGIQVPQLGKSQQGTTGHGTMDDRTSGAGGEDWHTGWSSRQQMVEWLATKPNGTSIIQYSGWAHWVQYSGWAHPHSTVGGQAEKAMGIKCDTSCPMRRDKTCHYLQFY